MVVVEGLTINEGFLTLARTMSKVTSKRQVTIPKTVATQYGIEPGDEIEFQPAGDVIRVLPPQQKQPRLDAAERLRLFDQATERQQKRQEERPSLESTPSADRGWTREELYSRGAD